MENVSMVQIIVNRRAQSEIMQRMLELGGLAADGLDPATADALIAAWQDCAESAIATVHGSTISLQALALAEYLSGTGPWDEGGRFAGNNRYQLAVLASDASPS